ncbi:hypothetical protein [Arthrobacter wenxiniae]|uniref:Uncharacterized protein n=1 Tax=Arthrobacter wenxiniae TaxID=2713570 RepID=A0A7Y7IFX4_9MICC|nr:hypothetical protein [Arthrobacter wenxiniae]NVM94760.1 hypothetical protein [Arthrobacter wenxiniae]
MAELGKLPPGAGGFWGPVWRELALYDARLIDRAVATGEHNIVSTMQSRLANVIDRLVAGAPRGPEDTAEWAAWAGDL